MKNNTAVFAISVLMILMMWQVTVQHAWDQGCAAHKPDAVFMPVLAVAPCTGDTKAAADVARFIAAVKKGDVATARSIPHETVTKTNDGIIVDFQVGKGPEAKK